MKANGRRWWRKWARRWRQKLFRAYGRDVVEGNKPIAWMKRHKSDSPLRPDPLPANPFSPLSLVGMTMGARKRKARASVTGPYGVALTNERQRRFNGGGI